MATLLMRISAPMQSWGTKSNFSHRDAEREPFKSGIVGRLRAALGRPRDADIADLRALRLGVRINRPVEIICDFHSVGADGVYLVEGKVNRRSVIVSERHYLADAKFLVGLEGETNLLTALKRLVRN